jgi:hypothetical protein
LSKSRRPAWLRSAAALILALGLLTATAANALAGPKLTCNHASWDHASWDCGLTKLQKIK